MKLGGIGSRREGRSPRRNKEGIEKAEGTEKKQKTLFFFFFFSCMFASGQCLVTWGPTRHEGLAMVSWWGARPRLGPELTLKWSARPGGFLARFGVV